MTCIGPDWAEVGGRVQGDLPSDPNPPGQAASPPGGPCKRPEVQDRAERAVVTAPA
jgi:hypothetical protein